MYCSPYFIRWGVVSRFRDEVRVDLLTAGSQAVSLAGSWNKATPEPVLRLSSHQHHTYITDHSSSYLLWSLCYDLSAMISLLAFPPSNSCCLLDSTYTSQNVTNCSDSGLVLLCRIQYYVVAPSHLPSTQSRGSFTNWQSQLCTIQYQNGNNMNNKKSCTVSFIVN